FTDGAFECPDRRDRVMGQQQFINKIREYSHLNIHELVTAMYEVIQEYCGPGRFVDDVTILGVHYKINES
ncbi:MAG: SpoIIE family protein phosphatase, partial [Spirochaetota bacterium]